jgi:hypothetical protein
MQEAKLRQFWTKERIFIQFGAIVAIWRRLGGVPGLRSGRG